jgi:hypothetical protein
MSDISGFNSNEGSVWQLEAVGGHAVVSYRCNILHDQFLEGGRHFRDAGWTASLRAKERAMFRRINAFLSHPEGILDPAGFRPIVQPAIEGFREAGLRGLARALYIRARRSQAMYLRNAIRNKGFRGHFLQHRIARRQHEAFLALPIDARCGLVRTLYFADPALYGALGYEVWRGGKRIDQRPIQTPVSAGKAE